MEQHSGSMSVGTRKDVPVGNHQGTDRKSEGGGMYSPSNSRDMNGDVFSDLGGMVGGGGLSSREGLGCTPGGGMVQQQQQQQQQSQQGGVTEENMMIMMEEMVQRVVKESLVPLIQRVMLKVDVLDSKVKQMQLAVEEIGKDGREGKEEVKVVMEEVKGMMEEVKGMMVKMEDRVEGPDVEALEAMVAERVTVSEGEKDKAVVHSVPTSTQASYQMMPPPPPPSHHMSVPPPPPSVVPPPPVHHPHPPPPPAAVVPQQGMHYSTHQPMGSTVSTNNHYTPSMTTHVRPPPPTMPSTSYHGYDAPQQSHMYAGVAVERMSHSQEDSSGHRPPAAVPIEKVIDDISIMGFSREEVRNVLRELKAQGKPIDMNIVLDRLGAR